MAELHIFIPGKPRAKGSAKWLTSKSTGKSVPVRNKPLEEWNARVSQFAYETFTRTFGNANSWMGPVVLEAEFSFERPESHYTGGNRERGILKHDVPAFPIGKPDRGKLLRCIEDAVEGIVYQNDAQVVDGKISKVYGQPGASLWISRLKSLA